MSDTATDLLPAATAVAPVNTAPAAPVTAPAATEPSAAATAPVAEDKPVEPASPKAPASNATPEEWSAYFKEIGAPKDAAAYAEHIVVPDGIDGDFAKKAAGWMAEAALMPHQAKLLSERWNSEVAEQVKATKDKSEADQVAADKAWQDKRAADNANERQTLQTEWGADKFEANMNVAKQAVAQFLPAEQAKNALLALEDSIGYAGTMRLFHAIGKGLGEGSARGLSSQPFGVALQGMDRVGAVLYGNTK